LPGRVNEINRVAYTGDEQGSDVTDSGLIKTPSISERKV